jgi:hypothetical protein
MSRKMAAEGSMQRTPVDEAARKGREYDDKLKQPFGSKSG